MDELAARMAALRERFIDQALEIASLVEAGVVAQDWSALAAPCHSLAGRAGMFGHGPLGEAARAVEEAIDGNAPASEIEPLALGLLDQLRGLRQLR